MKGAIQLGAVIGCLWMCGSEATAEPDLRTARQVGPCTLFRDDHRRDLFYYGPGDIVVGRRSDGSPDFHFLQARYTGSATTGDQGKAAFHSLLTFGATLNGPGLKELQGARQALLAESPASNPELRPLPIGRLEARLIYATVATAESPSTQTVLPEGHFESAEGQEPASGDGFWVQRTYSVSLEALSAQAFAEAFRRGQVVLSISYAFYAPGIPPDHPLARLTGSPALVEELQRLELPPRVGASGGGGLHLVKAGATELTIDPSRWKSVFRQVDINEGMPPGYPVLEVRCYDFQDALRPDLYEKRVEIQGQALGRGTARMMLRFGVQQPDLHTLRVRFPVAVRLDKPYSYRSTEVGIDGESSTSEWRTNSSWNPIIDVTTSASSRVGGKSPLGSVPE